MTDVKCSICENPMSTDGALILSPPQHGGMVHKYVVCSGCWTTISKLVGEKK